MSDLAKPRHVPAPFILRYVCKFCGASIATYPGVPSTEPVTLSVCDSAECRRQASEAYRAR